MESLSTGLFDSDTFIKGLTLDEDFLTMEMASSLLDQVDQYPWQSDLQRRVQHHGWRYDYRARRIDTTMKLGPLPSLFLQISQRLYEDGRISQVADQVIVNEYLPGQGIAAHIDCEPCFGPEIATISLGDVYPMIFTHIVNNLRNEVWLPIGSACIMSGESRYLWTHEIPKRKSDIIPGGGRRVRKRRVSLTFRKVITQ